MHQRAQVGRRSERDIPSRDRWGHITFENVEADTPTYMSEELDHKNARIL